MLVVSSAIIGVLIFFAIVLVTILLGATSRGDEKEIRLRTEEERRAGLTGDFNSESPHRIHHRYVEP